MEDSLPFTPAHAYHEIYGPAIFEPLAERLMACGSPEPGARVLDVACGTGVVTRRAAALAGPSGRVVGVDINPAMVAVARSIDAPGAPIEYHEGDATSLAFDDASFDRAYCQQGLQFVPDRPAAVAEIRRAVRDGGHVVIAVWRGLDHNSFFAAMADAEEPHLRALDADMTYEDLVAPFSFGVPDALGALLVDAGFERVDLVGTTIDARFAADRFVERLEYPYAAVVPAFATDLDAFRKYLDAITAATRDVVEEYRVGNDVVVPMHTTIATAC
jgi:SAM-dependent methyltransferase